MAARKPASAGTFTGKAPQAPRPAPYGDKAPAIRVWHNDELNNAHVRAQALGASVHVAGGLMHPCGTWQTDGLSVTWS